MKGVTGIQFFSHIRHIQVLNTTMAGSYRFGQHGYRTFPSLQKILLASTGLEHLLQLLKTNYCD